MQCNRLYSDGHNSQLIVLNITKNVKIPTDAYYDDQYNPMFKSKPCEKCVQWVKIINIIVNMPCVPRVSKCTQLYASCYKLQEDLVLMLVVLISLTLETNGTRKNQYSMYSHSKWRLSLLCLNCIAELSDLSWTFLLRCSFSTNYKRIHILT